MRSLVHVMQVIISFHVHDVHVHSLVFQVYSNIIRQHREIFAHDHWAYSSSRMDTLELHHFHALAKYGRAPSFQWLNGGTYVYTKSNDVVVDAVTKLWTINIWTVNNVFIACEESGSGRASGCQGHQYLLLRLGDRMFVSVHPELYQKKRNYRSTDC